MQVIVLIYAALVRLLLMPVLPGAFGPADGPARPPPSPLPARRRPDERRQPRGPPPRHAVPPTRPRAPGLEPGARMPFGHRHREQEEAYVVVAGSGRAKLDDEVVELTAWDVLRVAPAMVRSFEAGPKGVDLICIGGRKPKGGDTERVPDFWD